MIYQIPNTEHMAYRLVRTLVYKRMFLKALFQAPQRPTPATDFDFPNQTPTQTVSLIPTPRLYTKVRTSL